MRRVHDQLLWIGNVRDVRDMTEATAAGVEIVVDVACDDPAINVSRSLVFCRFPLVDGPGNPDWLLRAALTTIAFFLRENKPIMVACSAGLSRSVSSAAGGLSLATGRKPDSCLDDVKRNGGSSVSPGLWREIKAALA